MSHEPKKKHSTARKGKRRASIMLSVPTAQACKNCGAVTASHTVCDTCGFYNGKQIVKKSTPTVVRRRKVAENS
jgi:large subunit ribosomal protein L32